MIGAPGTGKSHIAKTLSHAAIPLFQKTVYREANMFFYKLIVKVPICKNQAF
ncbi:MAG: hypothetical protein KAU44_05645 [Candidatus Marinimicrobia bacterium]|nr:hypothetical protein [Candidatus Neomarinimicrobiota bacterium]